MASMVRRFLFDKWVPPWVSAIVFVALASMFLFRPDWSNADVRFQLAVVIVGTLIVTALATSVVRVVKARRARGDQA